MTAVLTVLIILCALEALTFVVFYAFKGWHSTAMGRHLMAFGVTVAILLGMRVWSRLVRPLPDPVWVVGFAALAIVLAWRLQLLLAPQTEE